MAQLFEPRISYAAPTDPRWKRAIIRLIERLTGQPRLEKMYRALRLDDSFAPESFWQDSLNVLSVSLDYAPDAFSQIPKEGPLVVIANHPFGVLDGLTICHLASRMRANFQILTNS
ncbi:MAG: glycerol acyltransferase, partial [Bacteroidota bacterium]